MTSRSVSRSIPFASPKERFRDEDGLRADEELVRELDGLPGGGGADVEHRLRHRLEQRPRLVDVVLVAAHDDRASPLRRRTRHR